jgi:prevent-host-death family protein
MAIVMYMKRVSVAEARNNLPALIHETETEPIEILRRGKPVAVLVSVEEFARIPPRPGFYDAMMAWRAKHASELDDASWLPKRDKSAGRKPPTW